MKPLAAKPSTKKRTARMQPMKYATLLTLAALGSLGTGCGGHSKKVAAFSTDWENDRGKSINVVYEQARGHKLPEGIALVVGVTRDGLIARSLDGKESWSYSHALDSRPSIASDVVVGSGGGSVFCLDAHSGKPLWSVPSEGLRLRGAGDDGKLTAVSLGADDVTQNRLLVIDRQGSTVLSEAPVIPIGVPAVLAGMVFVPWGEQYVSAIDLQSGNETGRLLSRSTVSHALNIAGDLYFGERGLVRFDDKIAEAARNPEQFVTLPDGKLPGNPQWLLPGTRVTPKAATAIDKVRLYARPNAQGTAVESGRFAASYFRLAMGFDAKSGDVAWVHSGPQDYLTVGAGSGGFVYCDASGKVTLLAAASGEAAGELSLGAPLSACVVQTAAFKIAATKSAGTLLDQLQAAILLEAPQLVTAQRFLLDELHKQKDPAVTQTLIRLATNPRTAPGLLEDARKLLAERRDGAEYMLEALAVHYDFLSGVLVGPPVGPMADALAAMGEKRAAPLLAEHLNDPVDTPDDVKRTARALEKLAGSGEYDALKTFFVLYRAAANDPEMISAVISVAKALIEVGGELGRSVVASAAKDPLTQRSVTRGIEPLLAD
jgi:outer membrane protein assembly factor BamB